MNFYLDIIKFKSPPKQTFFAPEWDYTLCETQISGIDFSEIAKEILSKEFEIVNAYPADKDGYTELGSRSLTSRYKFFNVFSWQNQQIQLLKDQIHYRYIKFLESLSIRRRKVWIQCWANVMRYGEEIKPHIHTVNPFTYLGGHVTIQTEESFTGYINPINQINEPEIYYSQNEIGKLTFFQANIPHFTSKYQGKGERITIAFDIIVDENVDKENKNIILFDEGI
jgi:hypothetical protein